MEQNLIKIVDGVVVVDAVVEKLLDDSAARLVEATEADKTLRKAILNAMIGVDISTAKVGPYTLSQVVPRPTVNFDTEAFLREQSDDVIAAFCSFEDEEIFDLERLKSENPELVAKYTIKKTIATVDTKKLEKTMLNVYSKYASEVKSDKPITLKITKAKEK